jgi:hypothetical protein
MLDLVLVVLVLCRPAFSCDNVLCLVINMCLLSCLQASQIIAEMGWYQLFTRGLALRILMVGTLTGLQWGIYDAYKVYVGLPTTGSVAEKPAAPAVEQK